MRNLILKQLTTIIILTLFVTGCVKLELNPGNIISDTIEASKSLYKTVKRKNNGEEERIYSHSIPSSESQLDSQKIIQCHNQIKSRISASNLKITEILSESSKVATDGQLRSVHCSIEVTIKDIS